jgi:hypothetical protein
MTKQINKRRQSLLLATIATFIVLGASGSVFGQKNLKAQFPKPDFSAMEEYWEIVSYEFDYTGNKEALPQLVVVAKKKQKDVLYNFDVYYYDQDGVKVSSGGILWYMVRGRNAAVGEPVREQAKAPFMEYMKTVKKIVVTVSDTQ